MVYLLYGLGIGNLSIQKYFDSNNIDYVIYDDNQDNDNFKMNDIKLIIIFLNIFLPLYNYQTYQPLFLLITIKIQYST